jgi:hypothetical protein
MTSVCRPISESDAGARLLGNEVGLWLKGARAADADAPLPTPTRDEAERSSRLIVCRACGARLARSDAAISVRGEHEHVCVNPSGIPFRIRCFREVTGYRAHGAPEAFFSWFEGFEWQVVLCAACGTHLGWRFSRPGAEFFGLIASRIAERSNEAED